MKTVTIDHTKRVYATLRKCDISFFYHITHVDNLPSILRYGLQPHNNSYKRIDISNREVNDRRTAHEPLFNRPVHSYVPLYFNPRNAMLYRNQKDFGQKIVILGISPDVAATPQTLFTNANAASTYAHFTDDISDLLDRKFIDWSYVRSRTWYGYDYLLKRSMMAEVLVPRIIHRSDIKAIFCQTRTIKETIQRQIEHDVIATREDLFFKELI